MTARRPTRLKASARTGAALSLLLAAAVLVSSGPARAADDDVPLDSKILGGLMEAIGLRKDGEAINYQERAPLVIPPSRTLPPPEKPGSAIANNPAWPKDPDVQRAKEEAARERDSIKGAGEQILHDESRLSEAQMTPGAKKSRSGRTGAKGSTASNGTPGSYGYGERLSSQELGYKGGLFSNMFGGKDDDVAKFTGEPPRVSLTEPPRGYRTPSPDQPYGLSGKTVAPKATNYSTEHGQAER